MCSQSLHDVLVSCVVNSMYNISAHSRALCICSIVKKEVGFKFITTQYRFHSPVLETTPLRYLSVNWVREASRTLQWGKQRGYNLKDGLSYRVGTSEGTTPQCSLCYVDVLYDFMPFVIFSCIILCLKYHNCKIVM